MLKSGVSADNRAGIGSRPVSDDRRTRTRGPLLELFAGRSTERVRSGQ